MVRVVRIAAVLWLTLVWFTPPDREPYLRHCKLVAWMQGAAAQDTFVVGVRDSMQTGVADSEHVNVGCIPPPSQRWSMWWITIDTAGNPVKSNVYTTIFLP